MSIFWLNLTEKKIGISGTQYDFDVGGGGRGLDKLLLKQLEDWRGGGLQNLHFEISSFVDSPHALGIR